MAGKKDKRKRIKEPTTKSRKGSTRIPEPEVLVSTINENPTISFLHLCEKNCQLQDLGKQDLKQLSKFLKRISCMTWSQIRNSDGIKMKKIPTYSLAYSLPASVSEEEEIFEMRVSDGHRLWGFQNRATFYVIWFDPTHSVCPA
ncbi:MAG6450 family protein [Bacillus mesophilum]|uniref:Uncharacterized protein n=1 Tax=Bacillus mesophilum TaxID=1071718 RepID=A0A7V7V0D0_9BACI|nr:hypothetical protein [Bacillus mesophilum]KAB2335102.1 hypothetical protein F7732_00570 [Bacillus mesophilum]